MQKRSKKPISRVFDRVLLPAAFPMKVDYHRQGDARITYLHYHDCLEVGYCHKGSGIFMVEEKVFRFNAGDVCVINQDETHLAQSAQGTASEWHFLYFDPIALAMPMPAGGGVPSFDGRTLAGRKFANILAAADHPEVGRLVREIIGEWTDRRPHVREVVRGLVLALMGRLHRLPNRQGRRGLAQTRQRDARVRVAPAFQWMSEGYAKPLPMPALAAACHCSVPHFRRIFKLATGSSPLDYLNRLRIEMAAATLKQSEEKIIDIAAASGFPTLSSFNRLFRQIKGQSPRRWRRS